MSKKLYVKLQTPVIELKVTAKDAANTQDSISVGFHRYDIPTMEEKIVSWQNLTDFDAVVKAEIAYICNAKVEIEDTKTGKVEELIVDTRTAEALPGVWETPKECLEVMIDKYFASLPWKTAIFATFNIAITNASSYKEDSLGN
jgi:hypothetical protein